MNPIYLDYAATTPVDFRVAQKMQNYLTQDGCYGNPSSLHAYGNQARDAIGMAREQVASLINAHPDEIIWTSGATESDNLAIKGAARLHQKKGQHIVTMKTEHKAVLDTCQHLEKEGYRVTYLSPEQNGLLNLDKLKAALCEETILVSLMHINNETGVIQNIDAIAELTAARNILLHVDAAQSAGKIKIDVEKTPLDLISLTAHKIYGPKGIGALYLRKKPRVRVEPLIHGGGHEQGMRSGTLATHQIVGMGEAFHLAKIEMSIDYAKVQTFRNSFVEQLRSIKNLHIHGDLEDCSPYILNLRFEGMFAEAILAKLPMLAVSQASACQAKGTEGSYVLQAMGLTREQVKSAVRFSFGRFTRAADIDSAANMINTLMKAG